MKFSTMMDLPHDSTNFCERYGMATPNYEAYTRVYRAIWYDEGDGKVAREDMLTLLAMADSYIDLIDCTSQRSREKLRDMRRALRAKAQQPHLRGRRT